jgi:macrolide transport system ATP-binding/permease protein
MTLKRLWERLRHPGRVEAELEDEVRAYYETVEERRVRQGLTPGEARRATRLAFDDPGRVKERVREARAGAFLDSAAQDLRYALRVLRKNPGFAAVATLSLGLGLGANTAIFTLIDTVLLKSLPVAAPERLYFVDNSGGKSGGGSGPPYPCFEILRDRNTFFSGMAAFSAERFRVTIDGAQEAIIGQYASGGLFDLLGVGPAIGRTLTPEDDSVVGRGGPNGAAGVISYALWERRFGKDPAVLGKSVLVGTTPVTIVGVTRAGFFGLEVGLPADLTVPMMIKPGNLRARTNWWFSVVGRLKDGAPVEAARAELDGHFRAYLDEVGYRDRKYFSGIALVPASKGLATLRRQFSRPLVIVMTIVGLVLLIGCANLANLLLARASARRHEMALRLAIGASRARLARQLLTEGLLLVALSGIVGAAVAKGGVALLVRLFSGMQGRIQLEPHFDLRVAGFACAVALLTALLFSIAPVWHATRADSARSASGRSTGGLSQSRLGNALVVVQLTLSIVLLCGAALFLRTLRNLNQLDAGFDREGVRVMLVDATIPRLNLPPGPASDAELARIGRMWTEFLDPIRSLPSVRAASVSTLSPFDRRDRGILMTVSGRVDRPGVDRGIHVNQVGDGYFPTFGIKAVAGRLFAQADDANAPRVAILNESAARREFPDGRAVGRRVTFPGQLASSEYEIVGVVRDVRYENLRKPAEPMVYVPIQQPIDRLTSVMVGIRSVGDFTAIHSNLRQRAASALPGGFAGAIVTLRDQIDASLLQERLLSILASIFGGLALLLAAIGLYGVMSYTVIRRTREIGIRIAVGARRGDVVWMVLRSTVALAAAGLALGIPLVLLVGRYVETQLFGVQRADPLSIFVGLAVLLTVAIASGAWPAWRAGRLDPMASLRQE